MAKVLNYTKYHKINVADHRFLHCQQQQQQLQQQLLLIKQQQLQRQQKQRLTPQTSHTIERNNNNKETTTLSHFNNEFINYTKLQQHVANAQQPHLPISNNDLQQLTSVSSFSVMKNRNSKINNSCHVNSTFLPSLSPPLTPASLLPPSTTCSYTPAPLTAHIASSTADVSSLAASSYSNYSTCCVLTYNLFTAYAEAATLQLKRKTQLNKLLHVSGHPDMRSICYLILMAFFYWGVMIRAAVATNLTTTQAPTSTSHVEELNTETMFYSNLTKSHNTNPATVVTWHSEENNATRSLMANVSIKLPVSLLLSDDTLTNYQRRLLMRREAANVPDFDDDDSSYHDDELDEYEILINNKSGK